jgi:hypothetical protein
MRSEVARQTIQRFKSVYAAWGTPRIAVFLNRALSDEVREWRTDARLVVASGSTSVRSKDGQEERASEIATGTSISTQKPLGDESARPNPGETWMWEFEGGFLEPFLAAGGRMVDRATIMRLSAARLGMQSNTYAAMAVKKVEMDALVDHADLFVEILITHSPASPYGYEFKAIAKEVKTGVIVAHVMSRRWKPEERWQRSIVPTSRGYEIVDTTSMPLVHEISADLALELMNALMHSRGA